MSLFKREKKSPARTDSKKSSASANHVPDFAPGDFAHDTAKQFFDRGAGAMVERNRWFLISMVLAVALVIDGLSFNQLFPLKTVETFAVEKAAGGRLVVDPNPVGSWAPDSDSTTYWINQWASNTWKVNKPEITETLAASSEFAIGAAADQLRELRKKDNPLASLEKHEGYSRQYEFISLNYIKPDVALLRFQTTERLRADIPPDVKTYALTATFTRVKPKSRAQLLKNPAGLYITSFDYMEESKIK
jgi:type IV secretory pathway component VirB8